MSQTLNACRTWFSIVAFAFVVLTTSLYVNLPWLIWVNAVVSLVLATIWLVPSAVMEDKLARNGVFIALTAIALSTLQLLPLPPAIWQSLPGREFIILALSAFGMEDRAMPISLSTHGTAVSLLAMVSAFGFFCMGLGFPKKARHILAAVIVAAALMNILFGLCVKSAPPAADTFLAQFYDGGNVSGLFFNRNCMAALLYVSIPMLTSFLLFLVAKSKVSGFSAVIFGLIYLLLILLGLGATASRTGILLSMLALLLSPILVRGTLSRKTGHSTTRPLLVVTIIGLIVLGLVGQAGLSRFARFDPVNEQRLTIYSLTLRAIGHYFPVGSGLGTFVPVYQQIEQPSDMAGSAYINHAHNDWLELALEGGLPLIVLMTAGVIWLLAAQYRVWTTVGDLAENFVPKAAAMAVILLLLHSLVDFPLRTYADAAVFALCLGLMAARPALPKLRKTQTSNRAENEQPPFAPSGPLWPDPRPTVSGRALH